MSLTKKQYKTLKIYLRYEAEGLTVKQVLRQVWKSWLFFLAVGALVFAWLSAVFPALAWLYVGLLGGAILRDVRYILTAIGMWPVTRQILDFKRIATLVEEHEADII
jgi:hypothetical protein